MAVLRAERRQPREAMPEVLTRHAQQVAGLEQEVTQLKQEHDAYRTTAEEVPSPGCCRMLEHPRAQPSRKLGV